MKIKFEIRETYDFENRQAEQRGTGLPKIVTLAVVAKYKGFYGDEYQMGDFAKKMFQPNVDDATIAEWASTTIATCLRALVPESERAS